jgi:hypothetical protein
MTLEELRSKIDELDEIRRVAEVEVAALRHSQEQVEELEKDLDAVLASLADFIPEALDSLTGEERNRVYRMLHIQITLTPEGYETTGVFRTSEPTPKNKEDAIDLAAVMTLAWVEASSRVTASNKPLEAARSRTADAVASASQRTSCTPLVVFEAQALVAIVSNPGHRADLEAGYV